jgi:hypothetical protein
LTFSSNLAKNGLKLNHNHCSFMKSGFKRLNVSLLAISLGAIFGVSPSARAQIVTLANLNSTAQINASSQAGMFNWMVDGVNQLYQQWFWYGIGTGTGQSSIDTLSAPTISQPNAFTVNLGYANANLSANINYVLTGGTLGSGTASLGESIHLVNTSGSSMTLRFYQYSDFDLMGSPGGDTLQLARNGLGKFYEALQSKNGITMSETDVVPGADHGEASFYPNLLNRLNGGSQIVLADNTGVVGPGDTSWAFEWDVTLAAGASLDISKNKVISGVPEPGVISLLGLGFLALVWRKRR